MRRKSEFLIEFEGLKYGTHAYDWELGKEFFDQFGEIEFTNAHFKVDLELIKDANMMVLKFDIQGEATYDCDLCLNPLQYYFDVKHIMVAKHGDDEEEEGSEDIIVMPKHAYELDVAPHIFELLKVAEPIKRNCEEGEPLELCEKETMAQYLSEEVSVEPEPLEEEAPEELDPRWEALRKLKNGDSK